MELHRFLRDQCRDEITVALSRLESEFRSFGTVGVSQVPVTRFLGQSEFRYIEVWNSFVKRGMMSSR